MSERHRPALAASSEGLAPYWPVFLARAVVALVVGLAVTFLADHSPRIGLLAVGALALGSGLVIVALGRGRVGDAKAGRMLAAQGIISAIVGALALALAFAAPGVGALLVSATVFAVVSGALELYTGIRTRTTVGRDWLTVGAATLLLGLVLLAAPLDPISVVGLIGAYAVLLGVYLVIAALSLKWAPTPRASATDPSTGVSR